MAGDYQAPERVRNAFDNRKLSLSAPCPTAEGRFSSLTMQLVKNNPRLTVYTNDPNDATEKNNNGRIQANLDAPTFFALIALLRRAVAFRPTAEEKEFKETVVNSNFTFFGGKRSDKPLVVSEIKVGKDQEGCVWISVLAYNKERPRIKFVFGPAYDYKNAIYYHNFLHIDGTPFTKAEMSVLYAEGYINVLSELMAHLMVTEFVDTRPEQDNGGGNRRQGGGGGGGYQRGGNNDRGQGGGYNSGGDGGRPARSAPADDFLDEI